MAFKYIPLDLYRAFSFGPPLLNKKDSPNKAVFFCIFLDEMPWMDTQRSNFVNALETFWNGWGNRRTDIMLIATGSATSWMADKIEANQGGLHARVTCNLHLSPFNLQCPVQQCRHIYINSQVIVGEQVRTDKGGHS